MEELEELFAPEADIDTEESSQTSVDPLFDYLKSNALIEVDDDFEYDGTEEGLQKALETTKIKRESRTTDELLGKLPPDFQALLEYGLNGGNSLQEYLDAYGSTDVSTLDLEDENNQETVLRQNWKQTSTFSDTKIDSMIEKLKKTGDLKEAAEEAAAELVELKESRKAKLIADQKERIKEEQETIQNRAKEFNQKFEEYKTTPERKIKIESIFKQDTSGEVKFNKIIRDVKSNYEHLLQLADLLVDYDSTKGFNLDRFTKKVESEKVKGLRDILESKIKDSKTQVKGSAVKPTNDDFDFEKFLNL
jgi:hypothetical protein